MEQLREALGLDRWVVLGHSYGGLVAQRYAVEYPESMLGMVLVCAKPAFPEDKHKSLGPTRQMDFISEQERLRIREIRSNKGLSTAQKIYNAFLNGDWKRQDFYKPSREELGRMVLYEWVHDPRLREDLQDYCVDLSGAFDGFPLPTLLIEGKWDLTWSTAKPGVMRAMHPAASLVVLENSGHSPFADEPERFFDILRTFCLSLRKVPLEEIAAWRRATDGKRKLG